jgi:NitT/TauT family transport system substrate-binding protein
MNSSNKIKGIRFIATFSLIFIGLIFISYCNKITEIRQVEKISIAEGLAPSAAPLFVADKKGLWRENALEVSPQIFLSGKLCLDALLGGKVDYATVAETPLAFAGLQDQKFYIIATLMSSEKSLKVIARKDAGIHSPKDLKGKKVATLFGTSAEFFMDTFLKANGVNREDVKATNLKPPDMVTALVRGDISACFIWEPHIHNMNKTLNKNAIVFLGDSIYTETFNLVVLQDYAKKHPRTIEKVLKTMFMAERFIQEKPDTTINIVSNKTGIDKTVLSEIWNDYKFRVELSPSILNYLQKEGEWAKKVGSAPSSVELPEYRNFIYTDGLKKVNPVRVTLK